MQQNYRQEFSKGFSILQVLTAVIDKKDEDQVNQMLGLDDNPKNSKRQRQADKWQSLLQEEYYKQLTNFKEQLSKLENSSLEEPNPAIESQFTEEELENRTQLRALQSKSPDEILIRSSVKTQTGINSLKDYRGTQLKGVSRNGNCSWQILYMYKGSKLYVCTIDHVLKAAIIYDIICIQSKGFCSKTNFNYTKKEIYAILQLPSLIKIKNWVQQQKIDSKKK